MKMFKDMPLLGVSLGFLYQQANKANGWLDMIADIKPVWIILI